MLVSRTFISVLYGDYVNTTRMLLSLHIFKLRASQRWSFLCLNDTFKLLWGIFQLCHFDKVNILCLYTSLPQFVQIVFSSKINPTLRYYKQQSLPLQLVVNPIWHLPHSWGDKHTRWPNRNESVFQLTVWFAYKGHTEPLVLISVCLRTNLKNPLRSFNITRADPTPAL